MSEWKSVIANSNLIQVTSARAVLIKLPKSEFQFWHPTKCVKQSGKNGYRLTISYTNDFQFKVFRPGKGKYNKFDKIEEKTISPVEFEQYFNTSDES